MDEGNWMPGGVVQPERPVERTISAADDHAGAVAEDVLLSDEVVEPFSFPGVDVVDPELARLERAVAGGDDQGTAQVRASLLGRDREELLAVLVQALEHLNLLAQQDFRAILEPLLRAELDKGLALDLRMPCNVEDVLLGIHGGDLAADLLEALDDPNGRIAMARVIRSSEAGRAGPEDRDVDDAVLAHGDGMVLAATRAAALSEQSGAWPSPGPRGCRPHPRPRARSSRAGRRARPPLPRARRAGPGRRAGRAGSRP